MSRLSILVIEELLNAIGVVVTKLERYVSRLFFYKQSWPVGFGAGFGRTI